MTRRLAEAGRRWARRWSELSIARRMAVAAVAMTLTFTFVTGLLSFAITWTVVRRSIDERLHADAVQVGQRLEGVLDDVVGDVARLSQNSLIENALVDSQGREHYLVPFLQDLKLAGTAPFDVALCDFQGRRIASNRPGHRDYEGAAWVRKVVDGAQPHGEIVSGPLGDELLIAYPVMYRSTGLAEGLLVAEIGLHDALAAHSPSRGDSIAWRMLDRDGRMLDTSRPGAPWPAMLTAKRRLSPAPPLDDDDIAVETGVPRSRAIGPLVLLATGYSIAAAVLVFAALAVSRKLADHVTRPLRQAESALLSAYEAMEQATEAIAILDRSGTFTYANAAARQLGQGGDQLVGARFWAFDPARSAAWWEDLWSELGESGSKLVRGPLQRGGRAVELETIFTAFRRDGRAYCVATARDVTDRVNAETVGRLASLGTLAAGVAHELNNPLAYVMANVEFVARELHARQEGDDERAVEIAGALSDTRDGIRRVRDIVRSLKRFSRPDTSQHRRVDVHRELEVAVALVGNELRHRARLVTQLRDVPPVLAPQHDLGQLFMNLLQNAAQAIPEGRSTSNEVRVSTRTERHEVVVEIRDSGVGIPHEIRARIFEPFFTTKPVGVGTGLGLSICHGIVADLGGRIEFDSEVGRGTTFRVFLPVAAAGPEASEPDGPARPGGCKVLVVDDEALVGRALARMMGDDAHVVSVSSVREGVATIRRGDRFDAILCDLMLPESSGMQFYADVRVHDEAVADRIGFMTGGAFTTAAREFLAGISNPVLEKPFDLDEVRAVLATIAARERGSTTLATGERNAIQEGDRRRWVRAS